MVMLNKSITFVHLGFFQLQKVDKNNLLWVPIGSLLNPRMFQFR